jgi:hypothetical protein
MTEPAPDRIVFLIRNTGIVRARLARSKSRRPVSYRQHMARKLVRVEPEKIIGTTVLTSSWQRAISVPPGVILDNESAARKRLALAKRRVAAAKKNGEELSIEDAAVAIAEAVEA